MNSRERVLSLLEGEPVDRPPCMPITMQFAADLIGVSYRLYETDYRTLVEGQIRVAEEFGFDYVNTMSDPAREASDCGAAVEFFDNSPAALNHDDALLADKSALLRLKAPDPSLAPRMLNGLKAVALLSEKIGADKIVEGWIEGPCAEGADLRGLNTLMLDFYDDPQFVRDLFEWVIEIELRFAREQIRAGADIIGIGDAAASLVGPDLYQEFVWPYEKRLIDGIRDAGGKTRLHICGNIRFALSLIGKLGADIVDVDYPAPLAEARAKMGADQTLLGNLNPVTIVRNGNPELITTHLARCQADAGERYIVAAGCEIPRDTPLDNLRAFAEYACTHRPAFQKEPSHASP
jgi:MtaA/CmuA family methyltransferase